MLLRRAAASGLARRAAAGSTAASRRFLAAGPAEETGSTEIGKVELEKFLLQFTCNPSPHVDCSRRDEPDAARLVSKPISKLAYTKGVVLVRCPCDKLHLIADRLGWFDDKTVDIETIAAEKGLTIKKGASTTPLTDLIHKSPASGYFHVEKSQTEA